MPAIQASSTSDRSRLIRVLEDLRGSKISGGDYNLAERLGYLTGLTGSISLAHALQQRPNTVPSSAVSVVELQKEVLAAREHMILKITHSFEPDESQARAGVRNAFISSRSETLSTFEPYRHFYTSQQMELAMSVARLRARVRKGLSTISNELCQLADLDKALEDSLGAQSRGLFAGILKLLEQHFAHQREENSPSTQASSIEHSLKPGAWLDLFYQDMCELLLAELDERLQAVFGLLEALNEHTQ